MKKLVTRSRSLVLVAVLAVVAAMCTVSTAHAAPPGSGAAASDAPCNFQSDPTCQSTDHTVTVSTYQYGDTSACSFVWNVDWGDGQSTQNLVLTDPPGGWTVLAQHTYANPGTYTISLTGETTAGSCTLTAFSKTFTLLAPTPPPSASGKACVFNAPTGGVTITVLGKKIFISGHVGWAYLADPTTGTWEYGANEGYTHKYGDRSRTWLAQGNWADVISVFKNALSGYHPGNYYTTYRCTSVAAILPDIALGVAQNQYGEKYEIPNSDCLSQTVEVLATYGASIDDAKYLLDAYYWIPNNFYASGYMSNFGPKQNL